MSLNITLTLSSLVRHGQLLRGNLDKVAKELDRLGLTAPWPAPPSEVDLSDFDD